MLPQLAISPKHIALSIAAVAAIASGGMGYFQTQRSLATTVADEQTVAPSGPVVVDFSQQIAPTLTPKISPEVAGDWVQTKGVFGTTRIEFKPKTRLEASQDYTVTLTNMKRAITGSRLPDITKSFQTQAAADVSSISPTNKSTNVRTNAELTLVLKSTNRGSRELSGSILPNVPLQRNSNDDQTFTWTPIIALQQGTSYTFTIKDTAIADPTRQVVASVTFTTVTAPKLVSAKPTDHVTPGEAIEITFDQPMAKATDKIVFQVPGSGSWTSDTVYKYTPSKIEPGTTYKYTLKAGLTSQAGGVTAADQNLQFVTNGAVTASLGPSSGDAAVSTNVTVSFDQEVDRASAESHFAISPNANGNFSWSGNTMTWKPNANLNHQTRYTATMIPGVKPVWGLNSTGTFRTSFTTVPQIVKLTVPLRNADYGMGCEISGLHALLAYRGISTSDWEILMKLGYNPRNRDQAANNWDDPNKMFVGFSNGRAGTTGYGVHAGPIASVGRQFGRNTEAHFNVSMQWIAAQIHAGRPVLFWGYSDAAPRADSWNTPGGYVVKTMYPQHGRVIWGVQGSADNPIGFWMNDTIGPTTRYWTAAQVSANMNAVPGVSNQAVVVY